MKKRAYEKPTCRVVVLQHKASILVGSGDPEPLRNVPWWDGEGD